MTYTTEELLKIAKETLVTKDEVNSLREKLVRRSKEKDSTIPTKEFFREILQYIK